MHLYSVLILCFSSGVMGMDLETHARETYDHVRQRCLTETKVDPVLVEQCNIGIFADDMKLKCYMKCLFDSFSLFKDDGFLDLDLIMTIIPEKFQATYTPMLTACLGIGGLDGCETAYKIHLCYYKENPTLHFLL